MSIQYSPGLIYPWNVRRSDRIGMESFVLHRGNVMLVYVSYWQCGLIINKRTDKVNPLNHMFCIFDKNVCILYPLGETDADNADTFCIVEPFGCV